MSDPGVGFRSLAHEVSNLELSVRGTIPTWLDGALLRNGPAKFEAGTKPVAHWFDGLAMLHKFAFRNGTVRYTNRFLKTDAYARAEQGELSGGFATQPQSLWQRLRAILFQAPYDNTNIIAERIGDTYVALTETPRRVRFDPDTLETKGHVQYDGPGAGHLECAHLKHDPWTGGIVNFTVEFGYPSQYHVYEATTPTDRAHITAIDVRNPAYMHSFALTKHYVVLAEVPFLVDPLTFLKPGKQAFIDAFRWTPSEGTRFLVIDRTTEQLTAEITTEAFFAFHHVNAHETDSTLVLDVETVPNAADSIAALSLDALQAGDLDVPAGSIDRFRIHPDAGTIERTRVFTGGTALPTVSPAVRNREHRYIYAQGVKQPVADWPRQLRKIDTEDGSAQSFRAGGYVSEPIFVPHPEREQRDAGVILAVMLDDDAEQSWLLVLDGETLTERARAALPHLIPFDFHGRYFPEL